MNLIKQKMTDAKAEQIRQSVQFMAIMAEMIKIEYCVEMDVRFKNPQANQFASRIYKDAEAIQQHLVTHHLIQTKIADRDFVQNYASELFRVFHFFIGLPIEQIKTVMDELMIVSETVDA